MTNLPHVILPLEGMPGSSVKDIARDMIAVAKRLDLMVSLDMNGTHLLALPSSTMTEIQRDYEAQLQCADLPSPKENDHGNR